jgi:hypothetical protein
MAAIASWPRSGVEGISTRDVPGQTTRIVAEIVDNLLRAVTMAAIPVEEREQAWT